MLPGETAVGCCPKYVDAMQNLNIEDFGLTKAYSGFTCSVNNQAQTCQSGAGTFASFPVVTCQSGSSNGLTDLAIPTTISVSESTYAITTYEIYAPMIEIRWQSSDLPANNTSASTMPTSSKISTATAAPGLSTGGEVAIGVVIPLVVLTAIALGIFIWRRRRSRTRPKPDFDAPAMTRSPLDDRPQELHTNPLYEMDEQRKAHEIGQNGMASYERHELQGNYEQRKIYEKGSKGVYERHELQGSDSHLPRDRK